uniref:Uncharacterized protein n=1 Tax=Mantoniella antarctica TaxID=81844 RepID=A0A7S0SRU6_9CHLO
MSASQPAFEYKPPKVSRDLANAVEDDWKRGAVDAAKHRAVKQLEGYDAFKNMVSVAHLRPYHAPNVKDHSGPAPPAFTFTSQGVRGGPDRTAGAKGQLLGDSGAHLVPPDGAAAFDKTWRRSCKTASERWQYLGLITPAKAAAIFKVEITGTALGEIILALVEGYRGYVGGVACSNADGKGNGSDSGNDDRGACAGVGAEASSWGDGGAASKAEVGSAVVALMRALTGAGRFSLASRLLPGKIKTALGELLTALADGGGCDAAAEAELRAAYGVR